MIKRPMSNRGPRQFMRNMAAAHPFLLPIHAAHMDDNDGELLPHLLIAGICRCVLVQRASHVDSVRELLWWLEGCFESVEIRIRKS